MEALPSRQTDLFSLAVLLFYMFCNSHPLVGKRILAIRSWDYPARKKMFGLAAAVHLRSARRLKRRCADRSLDPIRRSGRQRPGHLAAVSAVSSRPVYQGLHQRRPRRGARPRDRRGVEIHARPFARQPVWFMPMRQARTFSIRTLLDTSGRYRKACWSCGQVPPLPLRLVVGKLTILLGAGTRLAAHHLDDHSNLDAAAPIAEVVPHPTSPNVLGLKNISDSRWTATTEGGVMKDIDPGKSIVLARGTTIAFGRQTGEIR